MSIQLSKVRTKWNWELAFVLYCGGMSPSDIIKHKSFRGMPIEQLLHKISQNAWPTRRAEVAAMRATDILVEKARDLVENLKLEGIKHQEFMMSQLRRERNVLEGRQMTEEGQAERIQILDKLDQVARRLSKLDEQKEGNPITQGYAILVQMQANAHNPLREASTGILRSLNAHPEPVETVENDTIYDLNNEPDPEATKPDVKPMPAPGNLFGVKPISS